MKSIIALLAICCSLSLFAEVKDWKVNSTIGNTKATVSFGSDWRTRSSSDASGMVTYVANYSEGIRRLVVVNPEFFEKGRIDYCQLVGGVTPEHNGTIPCWAFAYMRGLGADEPVESVKVIPTGKSDILRSVIRTKGTQRDIQLYLLEGGAFVLETETHSPKHNDFIKRFFDSFVLSKVASPSQQSN